MRDPMESAERIRSVLAGEPGPVRDYILANSAAALWVTGRHGLREAVELAATAIDSGRAAGVLERWRQLLPAGKREDLGDVSPCRHLELPRRARKHRSLR